MLMNILQEAHIMTATQSYWKSLTDWQYKLWVIMDF